MPIKILDVPRIAPACKSREDYTQHRCEFLGFKANRNALETVVKGKDVVEVGCGVFGGLVKCVLSLGCRSYTGVDKGLGDPSRMDHPEDEFGHIDYDVKVPFAITIPTEAVQDPRVRFVYGVDFATFLEQVATNSVVTISTGLFHDYLLMPEGEGKEYVVWGIEQIARVSLQGTAVGLHHFFHDESSMDARGICQSVGAFFKGCFGEFNVRTRSVRGFEMDSSYYLGARVAQEPLRG